MIIERGGVDVAEFVYSYDAGGRLQKILYPDGIEARFDDGGTPALSGWNANGQLTHLRYLKDDGGLQLIRSFQYAYDDSGNRTQSVESNGNSSQDIEWQYRYDWFDRLVQVKGGVGGSGPALQREYLYDESNNRTYLDDYVNNRPKKFTPVPQPASRKLCRPLGAGFANPRTKSKYGSEAPSGIRSG